MNKNKLLLIILFGVLALMNLILLFKFKKFKDQEQKKTFNYEYSLDAINRNLKLNYALSGTKINENTINKNYKSLIKFNGDSSYIALFYSMDVCEICEEDVFNILSKYSNRFPGKFIAFLPVSAYSRFLNNNKEFRLNIKTIIPYDGILVHNLLNYRRATFFTINNEFIIHDIYIPSKPVLEKDLEEYLKNVTAKI